MQRQPRGHSDLRPSSPRYSPARAEAQSSATEANAAPPQRVRPPGSRGCGRQEPAPRSRARLIIDGRGRRRTARLRSAHARRGRGRAGGCGQSGAGPSPAASPCRRPSGPRVPASPARRQETPGGRASSAPLPAHTAPRRCRAESGKPPYLAAAGPGQKAGRREEERKGGRLRAAATAGRCGGAAARQDTPRAPPRTRAPPWARPGNGHRPRQRPRRVPRPARALVAPHARSRSGGQRRPRCRQLERFSLSGAERSERRKSEPARGSSYPRALLESVGT